MAGCSISMAPTSDDSPVLTSVSISGSSKERANWSLKMTIVKYELVSQKNLTLPQASDPLRRQPGQRSLVSPLPRSPAVPPGSSQSD